LKLQLLRLLLQDKIPELQVVLVEQPRANNRSYCSPLVIRIQQGQRRIEEQQPQAGIQAKPLAELQVEPQVQLLVQVQVE